MPCSLETEMTMTARIYGFFHTQGLLEVKRFALHDLYFNPLNLSKPQQSLALNVYVLLVVVMFSSQLQD